MIRGMLLTLMALGCRTVPAGAQPGDDKARKFPALPNGFDRGRLVALPYDSTPGPKTLLTERGNP